jgi:AAHS family benzoate transporter-like MFS transporter
MTLPTTPQQDARRRRTVLWVVSLATLGMVFDGFDLVAYGAVVPTFLKDPSQLGEVSPALAGTLGSYALLGMLFGALLAALSVTSWVAAG